MDPDVGTTGVHERLKEEALRRGFVGAGIVDVRPSDHRDFLERWIDAGRHGEMGYLAAEDHVAKRGDARRLVPNARSVIVVAEPYPGGNEAFATDRGVIARYARGRDYHRVLKERLESLASWLREELNQEVATESWVDLGPVLEREWANRAGLGWFGKNTMLIRPGVGSWFLLGAIFTDAELEPDTPFREDRCGSCSACLEACPTGALLGRDQDGAPVIDARRCISYLTIELKGPIPEEFREAIGNRVFGCDICQEVCPWNARFPEEVAEKDAASGAAEAYRAVAWLADEEDEDALPSLDGPDLVEFTERILGMSGKEYRRVFAESPLARPGRKGMLRNLCVALGNHGAMSAEAGARVRPVLQRATADSSGLVQEHAAWGLRRLADFSANAPPSE